MGCRLKLHIGIGICIVLAWLLVTLAPAAAEHLPWLCPALLLLMLAWGYCTAERRRLRALAGSRSFEDLAAALRGEDEKARGAAAAALGACGDPRAVDLLVRSLGEGGRLVDYPVWEALIALGPLSLEPMVRALGDTRSWCTRSNAAWVLGLLGDVRAAEPLVRAMDDPDPTVRIMSTWALLDLGPVASPALLDALAEGTPIDRTRAARVLGEIGDPGPLEPLVRALADRMLDVRKESALALGKLQDGRAVRPLIKALDDEDYAVRLAAAEALGNLGALAGDAVARLHRPGTPRAFIEAARRIERALRGEPHELLAADPLPGTGTEPEAAEAPPGTGTEPEAAPPPEPAHLPHERV